MVRRIQASNTAKHPSHGISASFNHTYHSLFFYFYFFFFFFFFSLRLPSLRRSTVLFPREEHIYIYHILHLGRVLMYRPHSFCVFHYFYFIIIVLFVFFYFSSTYCFSHSPCLLNFHISFTSYVIFFLHFLFFIWFFTPRCFLPYKWFPRDFHILRCAGREFPTVLLFFHRTWTILTGKPTHSRNVGLSLCGENTYQRFPPFRLGNFHTTCPPLIFDIPHSP